MKVIEPVIVTDAIFTSSTAPETDYAAWVAATSYVVGDRVIRTTTHRIYENLIAGVDSTFPENATGGATPRWLDIGPTNKWAMFDDEIGSDTSLASPLTVVLLPGSLNTISFIDFVGTSITVTLKDAPAGTIVYTATETDFDGSFINDIFDWFIIPYQQIEVFNFDDLPESFTEGELTCTITGTGTVSIGALKFGTSSEIGDAEYGAMLGLIDYSRKETNDFGRVEIVPRRFVKSMQCKNIFENTSLSSIFQKLAGLHTTPCVWIGSNDSPFNAPMTVYGFYKDFSIDLAFPNESYCTITIEGLI